MSRKSRASIILEDDAISEDDKPRKMCSTDIMKKLCPTNGTYPSNEVAPQICLTSKSIKVTLSYRGVVFETILSDIQSFSVN
jgi:hypothetical protein